LFTFNSCDEEEQVYTKEAILKWTGDYAVDGCGFFLKIDDKDYKPENENFISDEFKNFPNLSVLVKFIYLERKIPYGCGLTGPHQIAGIKIISIEKI
jgi:hypothetical protein